MERLVFRSLPKTYTEEHVLSRLTLGENADPEDIACARELIRAAESVADPKAILRLSLLTDRDDAHIWVDGVQLDCTTLAENFRGRYRVFPYVCTCGTELEDWSRTLTDPLHLFWADQIKLFYLGVVQNHLFQYVRREFLPTGHLSHINPGSLKQWPLTQQRILFSLVGDVTGEIGVTLTESCLMVPSKSTSGILFESETAYENCSLCPLVNCPGRRAPYEKNA